MTSAHLLKGIAVMIALCLMAFCTSRAFAIHKAFEYSSANDRGYVYKVKNTCD